MNPLAFAELLPVFQPGLSVNWNWPDSPEQRYVKYRPRSRRVKGQKQKVINLFMGRRKNIILDFE